MTLVVTLALAIGIIVLFVFAVKMIMYLKAKNTNTELWATVFEGLTHKTMNLELLKTPRYYTEKKVKRSGKDKDTPDELEVVSKE